MTPVVRSRAWALGALAVALGACAEAGTPRTQLRTPGAHTGSAGSEFPLENPMPSPTPTPSPTPKPEGGPVTHEEKRVIRGWADELRQGHVVAASRYFTVPSVVSNSGARESRLASRADVLAFNATLPCGTKLVKTRRSAKRFVIGTLELTERPGGACGTGTGGLVEVAFLIRNHRITQWRRGPDPEPAPTPTPRPRPPDQA
jgi:hypothetical protein